MDGIVHYCVANMPGAVALTSTLALTNQTLMYGLQVADLGIREAARENPALRSGLNVCAGRVTHRAVASSLGLPFTELSKALDW